MRTVVGVCHHDCPDSCGWVVTVEDSPEGERATKLRGNAAHPFSQGELCPKVNRFLERVYSPERVLTPLRRTGAKGAAEFAPISWSEALHEIGERWTTIVQTHGAEAIAPFSDAGNQSVLSMGAHERFVSRLGASRQVDSVCGATSSAGTATTYGTPQAADPMEIRHAKCIVLWGTNTRLTNRHLWPFIEEARSNGAIVVCVDPLHTLTAEAADVVVQPLPGTDVALMLGVIHVLLRDDLIDHDYVSSYATGFDEMAAEAAGWSPQRTADVCGLSAHEIEAFARLLGSTPPVHFRTLIGAEHREQGATFYRLLTCLPVLLGSWRERGGGYSRSVGTYSDASLGSMSRPELRGGVMPRSLSMNHLGRWLTDPTMAPPVMALLVWNANPLVTIPNAEAIRRGLERHDLFTVVHEQFLTDTARFADIVLPATTQIEATDVVASWGSLHLNWNERAIAPRGESVSNTELFRRLSSAMGFTEPALFASDDELLNAVFAGEKPMRGAITVSSLRAAGTQRLNLPLDYRPYVHGGFATNSGRAELASPLMASFGHGVVATYRPAIEGPHGELAGRFPLSLMTPKLHTRFLNSSYAHLPGHGGREGGPFIELSPVDADSRNILAGDIVEVFNDRAVLRLAARVNEKVRAGVVVVPFGWNGASHVDGKTANALTNDTLTNYGGGVAYLDTMVEVRGLGAPPSPSPIPNS